MLMFLLLRSWKIISKIVNIMKLAIGKNRRTLLALYRSAECKSSHVYTIKTWRIKGKFDSRQKYFEVSALSYWEISMLNQLPPSSFCVFYKLHPLEQTWWRFREVQSRNIWKKLFKKSWQDEFNSYSFCVNNCKSGAMQGTSIPSFINLQRMVFE